MKTGQWMYQIGESDIWDSGEYFNTKEEAIAAGLGEVIEENNTLTEKFQHANFRIGIVEDCSNSHGVDANNVLECIAENIYDEVGEVAEDYLNDVTLEHRNELEEKLNDVLFAWMEKYNYSPSFFKIVNIETIEI